MLSVRELKELTSKLDVTALERQLGPFVLIQRPMPPVGKRNDRLATLRLADPSKPATSRGVFDFEDLWVATLPPIRNQDTLVLGRSPDCDLVLDEDSVSKQHARIDWNEGVALLSDMGSSNGIFVNRRKLRIPENLSDNDLISLGSAEMFFMVVATLRRRMGISNSGR